MNSSLLGLKVSGINSDGEQSEGVIIDTYNSPNDFSFFYFVCVSEDGGCFTINQIKAKIDMGSLKSVIDRKNKAERALSEIKDRFDLLDIR
jgi:hypothetical protein